VAFIATAMAMAMALTSTEADVGRAGGSGVSSRRSKFEDKATTTCWYKRSILIILFSLLVMGNTKIDHVGCHTDAQARIHTRWVPFVK